MLNYKNILSRNVASLMAQSDYTSAAKLAERCRHVGHPIGKRTIGHLLDPNDAHSPTLETIVAIAAAFRISPHLLLDSRFEATPRAPAPAATPDVLQLAAHLLEHQNILDAVQQLLENYRPGKPLIDTSKMRARRSTDSLHQPTEPYTFKRHE